MPKQSKYTYTKLVDLNKYGSNEKVYVYALVAEVNNLRSVDISEHVQVATELHLRDTSVDSFTRCVIYSEQDETFAERIEVGQIIQLHRVRIRTKQGQPPSLFGKLKEVGLAIVLFSGRPDDDFSSVYQSSPNCSVPEDYEEKISTLRMLNASGIPSTLAAADGSPEMMPCSSRTTSVCHLDGLIARQYHDVVVQVISIFVGDMGNVILRCWDTTTPPSTIFFCHDQHIAEMICSDDELNNLANERRCDIVFYKEHGEYLKNNVKSGDVLLLVNLHYYVAFTGNTLVMHEGGQRFNRGITILNDSSDQKAGLLNSVNAYAARRNLSRDGASDVTNEQIGVVTTRGETNGISPAVEDTCVAQEPVHMVAQNADASGDVVREAEQATYTTLNAMAFPAVPGPITRDSASPGREARLAANFRQRRIHAVQLGWIAMYAVKKYISDQKLQPSTPSSLQRSRVLASRGAAFLIRSLLSYLKEGNKNLLQKFAEIPVAQMNSILERFLITYLEGTYENVIRSLMTETITNSSVTRRQKKASLKRKLPHDERQVVGQGALWEFIKCIVPGTSINFSSLPVLLSYVPIGPIFALICDLCGLWHTTSAKTYAVHTVCPACFARERKCSQLFLQCYFPFSDANIQGMSGEKKFYFLFPIPLLAFFQVDVPEDAVNAAQNWENGLTNEQNEKISKSVKDEVLSKYSFNFTGLIVRKVTDTSAVFEVDTVTFMDR